MQQEIKTIIKGHCVVCKTETEETECPNPKCPSKLKTEETQQSPAEMMEGFY